MNRNIAVGAFLAVVLLGWMWFVTDRAVAGAGASTGQTDLVSVQVDAQAAAKIDKVVIMLAGGEKIQTRLVEDNLAVELLRRGKRVVSRLCVERLLAEEMVKYRTRRDQERQAIHAAVIAKRAGAKGILVGTVYNEIRATSPGQPSGRSATSKLVRCISLQLLSVEGERILWTACAEFDDSASYNQIARILVAELLKSK